MEVAIICSVALNSSEAIIHCFVCRSCSLDCELRSVKYVERTISNCCCSLIHSFLCSRSCDSCVEFCYDDFASRHFTTVVRWILYAIDVVSDECIEVVSPVDSTREERSLWSNTCHVVVVTCVEYTSFLSCCSWSCVIRMLADHYSTLIDESLSCFSFESWV